MLLRSPLRWHTFRVMILTSLVWVIFGMCILVYYMECLNGNGVNCRNKGIDLVPAPQQSGALVGGPVDDANAGGKSGSDSDDVHSADDDWPHLKLPPYRETQLHTWVAPSKCESFKMIVCFTSPLEILYFFLFKLPQTIFFKLDLLIFFIYLSLCL